MDYDNRRKEQKNSHQYHPSVRLRNRFIIKSLKSLSFNNILDIWCGDWFLVNLIKNEFPNKDYSWSDISNKIITEDQKKYPWINFFVWDIWIDDEIVKKEFDVVVCSEVIEHIKNWENVIKNLSTLTKKWWYCILTTQSWKRYKSDINIWHLKHFTLAELEKEFKSYGLVPVKSYKKWFPFYNMQKWLYEKFEDKAKNIQHQKLTTFSKILFKITYRLFLITPNTKNLWPQIFMILQKR